MKTIKAVAMKYKIYEDNAPKVLAKGSGEIAKKILEKAKEFEVSIFHNPELIELLMNVEVNEEIPPELYKAIIEVFIWLRNTEKNAQLSQG